MTESGIRLQFASYALTTVILVAMMGACDSRYPGSAPTSQPGNMAPANSTGTINPLGAVTYAKYCVGCHGIAGDGTGGAAAFLDPQPCDFTRARFRFSSRGKDELPTDDDLHRTVTKGIKRSAMGPFEPFDPATMDALIAYVKTFSPRWREEPDHSVLPRVANPYSAYPDDAAIRRGRLIYHHHAKCWLCHPAYESADELSVALAAPGTDPLPLRPTLHESVRKPDGRGHLVDPPDFLRDLVRSGSTIEDLYRSIACGIGGSPMPTWYDVFVPEPAGAPSLETKESDLWALAYYVQSLIQQRPARLAGNQLVVRDRRRVIQLDRSSVTRASGEPGPDGDNGDD